LFGVSLDRVCLEHDSAILRRVGLIAVIGVAGEDLLGAIELLQQKAAGQEVRPGHRAKRQNGVGALDRCLAEPVGAADREGEYAGAGVPPSRKPVSKLPARPGCAALV